MLTLAPEFFENPPGVGVADGLDGDLGQGRDEAVVIVRVRDAVTVPHRRPPGRLRIARAVQDGPESDAVS